MTAAPMEVKELARRAGVGTSTIYAYLSGKRSAPARAKIDRLADELRVGTELRARMYAAAGLDATTDLSQMAADLVRGLPTSRERELAVELLRTQARFASPRRAIAAAEAAEKARQEAEVDAEGFKTIKGIKKTDRGRTS